MKNIDYSYFCTQIASLSRIPIRVYKNESLLTYEDPAHFPKDPILNVIPSLLKIDATISYYISSYDHFYGIIHYENDCLILGPTFQILPTKEKIKEFMFSLGITSNYLELYSQLVSNITPMPLELFLRELCLIYYFLSEEKLDISNVLIYNAKASVLTQNTLAKESNFKDIHPKKKACIYSEQSAEHTTLEFEKIMLDYVKNGDVDALDTLLKTSPSGKSGKVATTYLRQVKNIFITSTTLVCRAAIDGGMPVEKAFSLSDIYIQQAESYNNPELILNLQYTMVLDYASIVEYITHGKKHDRTIRQVSQYIQEHLYEELSVERIAKELNISRSYLSTKFKQDTQISLNQYIMDQRIHKAKELLKNTDQSISDISSFLCFSSQAYFQNIFKKYTGMTPKQYRQK